MSASSSLIPSYPVTASPRPIHLMADTSRLHAAYRQRMTTSTRRIDWTYWAPTGLFCLVFIGSALSYFVDYEGARKVFVFLEFPAFLLYPNAVAKLLGVAAILYPRWQTLKTLAFAGFFYDMVLALSSHIYHKDSQGWLAVFGLILWGFAFWADRRRFPMRRVQVGEKSMSIA